MKRIYVALIGASCAALGLQQARAVTVDELGTGPSEVVTIKVTGLVGLTGLGQGYAIQNASVNQLAVTVPDASSSLALLTLVICGLTAASWKAPRLAPVRASRPSGCRTIRQSPKSLF